MGQQPQSSRADDRRLGGMASELSDVCIPHTCRNNDVLRINDSFNIQLARAQGCQHVLNLNGALKPPSRGILQHVPHTATPRTTQESVRMSEATPKAFREISHMKRVSRLSVFRSLPCHTQTRVVSDPGEKGAAHGTGSHRVELPVTFSCHRKEKGTSLLAFCSSGSWASSVHRSSCSWSVAGCWHSLRSQAWLRLAAVHQKGNR